MGRPRLHGDATRRALLDAAERILEAKGVEALSVRSVAEAVGTTTRAVYTIFGSKDGLLVALGAHAFDLLAAAVDAQPVTDDPVADLVGAGAVTFRGFAVTHPALFRIGVQRISVPAHVATTMSGPANAALRSLHVRIARLATSDGMGGRSLDDAAFEFHALCEGLAAVELRCALPPKRGASLWADALGSLVSGWGEPPTPAGSSTDKPTGRRLPSRRRRVDA